MHFVLVALLLLAPTSGRERDDRSQTHPFIVDLGPMALMVKWFRAIRTKPAAFM
ncbi:MAG TPA: hypothetical protein VGK36_08475 [Candidatus Angelobacter sp.]|jgi:hypothetical protein